MISQTSLVICYICSHVAVTWQSCTRKLVWLERRENFAFKEYRSVNIICVGVHVIDCVSVVLDNCTASVSNILFDLCKAYGGNYAGYTRSMSKYKSITFPGDITLIIQSESKERYSVFLDWSITKAGTAIQGNIFTNWFSTLQISLTLLLLTMKYHWKALFYSLTDIFV